MSRHTLSIVIPEGARGYPGSESHTQLSGSPIAALAEFVPRLRNARTRGPGRQYGGAGATRGNRSTDPAGQRPEVQCAATVPDDTPLPRKRVDA